MKGNKRFHFEDYKVPVFLSEQFHLADPPGKTFLFHLRTIEHP